MQDLHAMALAQHDVATVTEETTARGTAEKMDELGLGCLVVVDDSGRPLGLVTDRDLTLRVVARTRDLSEEPISRFMSKPLVSVSVEADLDEVIHAMGRHGIRRIPILDGDTLVGMVALDDVLQALAVEMSDLGKETQGMMRHAVDRGILERLDRDLDRRLHALHGRLQYTNWAARESFLRKLDEFRERVGKAIGRSPDAQDDSSD